MEESDFKRVYSVIHYKNKSREVQQNVLDLNFKVLSILWEIIKRYKRNVNYKVVDYSIPDGCGSLDSELHL